MNTPYAHELAQARQREAEQRAVTARLRRTALQALRAQRTARTATLGLTLVARRTRLTPASID